WSQRKRQARRQHPIAGPPRARQPRGRLVPRMPRAPTPVARNRPPSLGRKRNRQRRAKLSRPNRSPLPSLQPSLGRKRNQQRRANLSRPNRSPLPNPARKASLRRRQNQRPRANRSLRLSLVR